MSTEVSRTRTARAMGSTPHGHASHRGRPAVDNLARMIVTADQGPVGTPTSRDGSTHHRLVVTTSEGPLRLAEVELLA